MKSFLVKVSLEIVNLTDMISYPKKDIHSAGKQGKNEAEVYLNCKKVKNKPA